MTLVSQGRWVEVVGSLFIPSLQKQLDSSQQSYRSSSCVPEGSHLPLSITFFEAFVTANPVGAG